MVNELSGMDGYKFNPMAFRLGKASSNLLVSKKYLVKKSSFIEYLHVSYFFKNSVQQRFNSLAEDIQKTF